MGLIEEKRKTLISDIEESKIEFEKGNKNTSSVQEIMDSIDNSSDNIHIYNQSPIGRLLVELSWSGKTIKRIRNGGIGYENVLMTEVLQGLNFLPRNHFLGEILNSIQFEDKINNNKLFNESESLEILLHPVDQ
jgi:hypothetical protein